MESLATRMDLRLKAEKKDKQTQSQPPASSNQNSHNTSVNSLITEVEGNICPICYQLVCVSCSITVLFLNFHLLR